MQINKLISLTILVFCSLTVSGFTDFKKNSNGSFQDVVGVDDPSVGIVAGPEFNAFDILKSSSNNLKFSAEIYKENTPIGGLNLHFDFKPHPFKFVAGNYGFEAEVYRIFMSFNGFLGVEDSDTLRSMVIFPTEPSIPLTKEHTQMHLDSWASIFDKGGWERIQRIGANFTWPDEYSTFAEPYKAWECTVNGKKIKVVLRVKSMTNSKSNTYQVYNIEMNISVR